MCQGGYFEGAGCTVGAQTVGEHDIARAQMRRETLAKVGLILRRRQDGRFDPPECGYQTNEIWGCSQEAQSFYQIVFDPSENSMGAIREKVVSDVVPNGFDRVELWAIGWQKHQARPFGNNQVVCNVPPCPIRKYNAVVAREGIGHFCQEGAHNRRIDPPMKHGCNAAVEGTDSEQNVDVFADNLEVDDRANPRGCPTLTRGHHSTESSFILE